MSRSLKPPPTRSGSEVQPSTYKYAALQHPSTKVNLQVPRSYGIISTVSRSSVSMATTVSMVTTQAGSKVVMATSHGGTHKIGISPQSPGKTTVTMATAKTNLATKHTLASLQKQTQSTASKDLKVMFRLMSIILKIV